MRFILRSVVVFLAGAVSFFVLLVAIAAVLCLLAVGAVCALYTVWAVFWLMVCLAQHDRSAGQHALHSILIAAGCFGFIVLTSSTVTDLFLWSRRSRLQLYLEQP
jgi:hypothetical protein